MSKRDRKYRVVFLPIGLALGIAWGVLFNNYALWIIFGLIFGQVIDLILYAKKKKD